MVLNEAASVLLDSSGNGSLRIGPQKTGVRWKVANVAVFTSTANKVPVAKVFLGPESPNNLLGGSFSGSNDSFGPDVNLGPGQFITVKWEGGDSGATATASLYGELIAPMSARY